MILLDSLCFLLEKKGNRKALLAKYYARHIVNLVNALRNEGRAEWLLLHRDALDNYGPSSDYATWTKSIS